MRAVGKKGGSCLVRFGLHDGVAADVVFDIGNTTLRCLFGLPDRRTRVYKTRHILLHPHLPLPHTLLPVLRTCALHHLPHFPHVHSVQHQEFFHAISPLLVVDVPFTSTRNPGNRQSAWSIDSRPGPQAMMASAIAAHVIWIGQPSGTVSSTMQVMNRRPNAAKRVPRPSTRSTGKMISPQPERKAMAAGAGKS